MMETWYELILARFGCKLVSISPPLTRDIHHVVTKWGPEIPLFLAPSINRSIPQIFDILWQ